MSIVAGHYRGLRRGWTNGVEAPSCASFFSGDRLTLEQVGAVALGGARVELASEARERVRPPGARRPDRGRRHPHLRGSTPERHPGGSLYPEDGPAKLQAELILFACGGDRRAAFRCRGARADAPARQRARRRYSGIRETTLDCLLVDMLQRDVIPWCPKRPRWERAAILARWRTSRWSDRRGEAVRSGKRPPAARRDRRGLKPVVLEAKRADAGERHPGVVRRWARSRCSRLSGARDRDIATAMTI